jgi:glyceraldehyde-3-phosphate dehydrogenase (NADP+)
MGILVKAGNHLDDESRLSAMITTWDAQRVHSGIRDAVGTGASVVTGGERQGAFVSPAIVADI